MKIRKVIMTMIKAVIITNYNDDDGSFNISNNSNNSDNKIVIMMIILMIRIILIPTSRHILPWYSGDSRDHTTHKKIYPKLPKRHLSKVLRRLNANI